MSTLPAPADQSLMGSAIHLEFIRTAVESGSETALEEVETFHRALFLHQHSGDLERLQQEQRLREDRLTGLETRLARVGERLAGEMELVPVLEEGRPDTQPSAPWNFWDRAMAVLSAVAIVCLLVFGVFNVSFNLLESGIVTFAEQPVRAYFWAAPLPVGALAVKIGWDVLSSRRKRGVYLWICLLTGVLAVLVWVAAYASVYPMLSRSTADDFASLSVFDGGAAGSDFLTRYTSGGVKRLDMILVAAQAVAEICLSAALGIYLTQLFARHRPVRLARNAAFDQYEAERRLVEGEVTRERLALADARGGICRIENQLTAYLAYVRSLVQREGMLRRDPVHQKRRLIEEMAERLRAGLAEVESRPSGGNGGSDSDSNSNSNSNSVTPFAAGPREGTR